MKHLSSLTFKVLGLTVVLLLVLAVPLLSQSSFAQGPPEGLIVSELEVTCILDNSNMCMPGLSDTFCLPYEMEDFLAHMALCQECGGQIDVTAIDRSPFPGPEGSCIISHPEPPPPPAVDFNSTRTS